MTSIEQKDQTDQEDLRQIEAELTDVLDKEKRNWTKIYQLPITSCSIMRQRYACLSLIGFFLATSLAHFWRT